MPPEKNILKDKKLCLGIKSRDKELLFGIISSPNWPKLQL